VTFNNIFSNNLNYLPVFDHISSITTAALHITQPCNQ